jgi:hypothetical protein
MPFDRLRAIFPEFNGSFRQISTITITTANTIPIVTVFVIVMLFDTGT